MRVTNLIRNYGLLGLLLSLTFGVFITVSRAEATTDFANETFHAAWQQLDGPVASGQVARPYLWGSVGGGSVQQTILEESYKDAKGGKRQVQYFAKGRMELTDPNLQPDFLGNGRLVLEMVTGRLQLGDNYEFQFDGAESPVAGGNRFAQNPGAPSYRAFQSLLMPMPSLVGQAVSAVLPSPENEGFFLGYYSLNRDNALGTLAKYRVYIPESSHSIPDVFWDYLNQTDANGLSLFNWQTLFGLPITDAYWVKVRGAGGNSQDILVQLFERRTLLYNPAAAPAFQVESGDVGLDYYNWRYQLPELPIIEDNVQPCSGFGSVQPAVGESGTTFVLTGSNFKPRESVSAWFEELGTSNGPNAGPGIYEQPVIINGEGKFKLRLLTKPFLTPSLHLRLVVVGNESGNKVVLNLKVVGSIRYTPGVEAAQPTNVPPNIDATLDSSLIRIGSTATLGAFGFLPNEPLNAWLSTPLNRVVSWSGLISTTASFGNFNRQLVADRGGSWESEIPGPGTPVPGIYAFTVQGLQSGKIAIAYFRTGTNTLSNYNPIWGGSNLLNSTAATPNLSKLPLDPALQKTQTWKIEQDNDARVGG